VFVICCIYSFGAMLVLAAEIGHKIVTLDDLLAMDEMEIWTSLGLESGPNGPIKQALMEMTTLAVDMHNQQQYGSTGSSSSNIQHYKPEMRPFLEHFFDVSIADLAAASNSRDPIVWHTVLMGKDMPRNGDNVQIYEVLSAAADGKHPNVRALDSSLPDDVLAISQHQLQQQLELDLPANTESAPPPSPPGQEYPPSMEYPRTVLDTSDMIRPASPEDTRVFTDEHWHQHERDVLFSIYNSLRGDSTTPIDKNYHDRKLEYYEWTVLSDEDIARHPKQQQYHCQWMGISCGTVRHVNDDGTTALDQKYVVTSVDMSHWNLRGTLPMELSELSFLKILNLSHNHLSGSVPIKALSQLNFLQHAFLNYNNLNGTLPVAGLPPRIREWNLAHNDFQGSLTLPSAVSELEVYDVSDNFLSGPIVVATSEYVESVAMSTWPGLKFFLAIENALTGLVPMFPTQQFPSLRTIDFSGNLLAATAYTADDERVTSPKIPTSLWDFLAADNLLSGSFQLPSGSGDQASELQTISVAHNQLTGPLPMTGWNQFQELGVLLMDHNRFTGTIPVGLVTGVAESLVFLDISYNKIKGSIATEIGLMAALHTINAMSNQITGNIPNEMTNMNPNLRLNFTDNLYVHGDSCVLAML
jgi:Leucine-rich repeat (LRR) protein